MNIIHTFSKRKFFLFCLLSLITFCNLGKSSLFSVFPAQKAKLSSSCVDLPKLSFSSAYDRPTILKLLSGASYYTPRTVLGNGIGSSANPLRVFIKDSFYKTLASMKKTPFYQKSPSRLRFIFEGDLKSSSGLTNVKLVFVSSASHANVVVGSYALSVRPYPVLMTTFPINISTVVSKESWFPSFLKAFGINYNHGHNKQAAIVLDSQKNVQEFSKAVKIIVKKEKKYDPHFVATINNILPFFEHIFIHEISHVLGLNHTNSKTSYSMAQLGIKTVPHTQLVTPSIQTTGMKDLTYYTKIVNQMKLKPHSSLVKKVTSLNANDINALTFVDRWSSK